jgi:DNA-binding FadR family transcriptional regulator
MVPGGMGVREAEIHDDEPMFVRDAVFEPIDTPTAVDEVARRIRQAIVLGVLRDGDRLPAETELAKRIGVGVMTVRAALSELRADGLLVTHRGRLGGSFVASSDKALLAGGGLEDPAELRRQAEILGGLEALATRLAADRITPAELGVLEDLAAEIAASRTPREVGLLNNRFHLTIAAASGNRDLVAEISARRAGIYATVFAVSGLRLPIEGDGAPHAEILRALSARDGRAAAEAMWEHHRSTLDAVLRAVH